MLLGKHFAKQWFNIDLNLHQLPMVIKKTLMAGNEEIVDLIVRQIDESEDFIMTEQGFFENVNRKSWVKYPVAEYENKGEKGYLYVVNNAYDLSDRMHRQKKLSLKNLMLILETEWESIEYGSFYLPGTKAGSVRGIFIPLGEINGDKSLVEDHLQEEEYDTFYPSPDQNVDIAMNLDRLEDSIGFIEDEDND